MSACNSSGVAIIIRSAHVAASATLITLSPSASTFLAVDEPGRSATAISLTPESFEIERVRPALAAIADDDDLLALDQIEIGVAIVIDTHVGFLPVRVQMPAFSGGLSRFVEREELPRRLAGVAGYLRFSQFHPVTQQKPDLHVADDESEEGAERCLRIVESAAARDFVRLQAPVSGAVQGQSDHFRVR